MKIIDISIEIISDMGVWPGDPQVKVSRVKEIAKGDAYNLSKLSMSLHAGTHIDAPKHFISNGTASDKISLDALIGKSRVASVEEKLITAEILKKLHIKQGERLMIKTKKNKTLTAFGKFNKDFSSLTVDAAKYLASKKLRCLGMDAPSPGAYGSPMEIHKILMNAGVWLIENLDLSKAKPGKYTLICLPLKIFGAEAAPARAVLFPPNVKPPILVGA